MKVLQITNDFCHTKVHSNLFRALDGLGVEQIVFNAVRDKRLVGNNAFDGHSISFHFANVVKPYHKFVYHIKRFCVFRELEKLLRTSGVDLCHASTLFTDGGLAYLLYKKYKVPYIVAVRATDIIFFRKAPHVWLSGINILLHAKKIIFISPSLLDAFKKLTVVRFIYSKIKDRIEVKGNGIDDFYLCNLSKEARAEYEKIVYVGRFVPYKNVRKLCEIVVALKREFPNIRLTLIGGGGNEECSKDVLSYVKSHSDVIQFVGPIYDKSEMIKALRNNSIFAMPSDGETFGLVYIEALTQNLALLYSKGSGVDGLIPKSAGIAVNPKSSQDIKEGLRMLLRNRQRFGNYDVEFEDFKWGNIASDYLLIYKNCLNENIGVL